VDHIRGIVEQSSLFDLEEVDDASAAADGSRRRGNKTQALVGVREHREEHKQEIGYGSRPFLLCNLPVRKMPSEILIWERRNGNFFLRIEGSPSCGLPYGSDRLIPILVATLAVLQQSREVQLGSVADICRLLGMDPGGYSYRRIMDGFERVFSATIYFGTDRMQQARLIDKYRMAFFDRMRLWYAEEARVYGNQHEIFNNVIYLSEPFWEELKQHPIPVDLRVVRALKDAPGNLDFYLWLTVRSWIVPADSEARIPIFGPAGLVQHLGATEYRHKPRFRQKVKEWLTIITSAWPACPAALDGDYLIVRHGEAIKGLETGLGHPELTP
jgi:hypothetical protein